MRKEKKIIMYDSDEAAKPVTVAGWMSSNGLFFRDEQSARYNGCTHKKCRDCDALVPSGYMICGYCRGKVDTAKWLKLEEKEWDGDVPLYSETQDIYFFDDNDLESFLDDEEERPSISSMELVICEKQMYWEVEAIDIYNDAIPEDGEPCGEIEKAFEELNKKIKACEIPISWIPGKFRPTTASVLKAMGGGE